MERLTAQAQAEAMLDRLGVERLLAERVRLADREARKCRHLASQALQRGAKRMGFDGPIDANEHEVAQRWVALAEQASNRGDKASGRLYSVVCDRERRADLERRERLAAGHAAPSRTIKQPRGVA